jgi:flagellar basal body-associated protein FliL
MQFLKKNYEKIILGVVVLAALGLVASLPFLVSSEKQKLADQEQIVIKPNLTPLQPLDMTKEDEFIQRAHDSIAINLDAPHKIFNPVRWQLKNNAPYWNPAGREIDKLEVTKISPLYEIYSLTSVSASEGLPTHYGIGITHQAAARVNERNNPKTTYVAMNQTTNNFTIVAAEGTDVESASVTLELSDTGKRVTITKAKPYERPEGYMADLVYRPDNKPFPNRRKTDTSPICFANECYKIVDITEREVVLLQLSNQKTWTKEYNPTNSIGSVSP